VRDPQRKPLGDRRLADAGLADQRCVVLPAPAERLDGLLDLGRGDRSPGRSRAGARLACEAAPEAVERRRGGTPASVLAPALAHSRTCARDAWRAGPAGAEGVTEQRTAARAAAQLLPRDMTSRAHYSHRPRRRSSPATNVTSTAVPRTPGADFRTQRGMFRAV
jgi:hypothetical protein